MSVQSNLVNSDGSLVHLPRFLTRLRNQFISLFLPCHREDYYEMQAVSNGFWVVFEDVDKAPPDVQCILLPLLEGTTSFFTGHGEVLWNIVSICSRRSHAYPLMLFTAFSFVWIC